MNTNVNMNRPFHIENGEDEWCQPYSHMNYKPYADGWYVKPYREHDTENPLGPFDDYCDASDAYEADKEMKHGLSPEAFAKRCADLDAKHKEEREKWPRDPYEELLLAVRRYRASVWWYQEVAHARSCRHYRKETTDDGCVDLKAVQFNKLVEQNPETMLRVIQFDEDMIALWMRTFKEHCEVPEGSS
jgi:hypothetical protein